MSSETISFPFQTSLWLSYREQIEVQEEQNWMEIDHQVSWSSF